MRANGDFKLVAVGEGKVWYGEKTQEEVENGGVYIDNRIYLPRYYIAQCHAGLALGNTLNRSSLQPGSSATGPGH